MIRKLQSRPNRRVNHKRFGLQCNLLSLLVGNRNLRGHDAVLIYADLLAFIVNKRHNSSAIKADNMARYIERTRLFILLGRNRIPLNSSRRDRTVAHLDCQLGRHRRSGTGLRGHRSLTVIKRFLDSSNHDLGLDSKAGVGADAEPIKAASVQLTGNRGDLAGLAGIVRRTIAVPFNPRSARFTVARSHRNIVPRHLGFNAVGRHNTLGNVHG